jgi:nitrogen fixation NifU-like protein
MNLYQENILDHYQNPRNYGQIDGAQSQTITNPSCGDVVTMFVKIENNIVTDISFSGSGCAISQASCSMLTEEVRGKTIEELKNLTKEDILEMIGLELSPNRLRCALLSLETLHGVLNNH